MKRNLPTIIGAVLAVTLLTGLALFGSNRAYGVVPLVSVVDTSTMKGIVYWYTPDEPHSTVVKRVLIPAAVLTCDSARREGLFYTDLDLEHVGVYLQISCYRPRK